MSQDPRGLSSFAGKPCPVSYRAVSLGEPSTDDRMSAVWVLENEMLQAICSMFSHHAYMYTVPIW